jgi:peptide/nickel transport system substrate-binding protein
LCPEVSVARCSRLALAILLVVSSRAYAGPSPNADSDWQEGRLPASIYEGAARSGGTLVIRIDEEPRSLDKITDSSLAIDWMLERKVLESMAEPDASKHPEYPLKAALALTWTVSADQLTFTFHLRRGVLWHDGTPFSGKDVVATVRKILNPSVREPRHPATRALITATQESVLDRR